MVCPGSLHETLSILAQWKICRRPTVSLCRDRSIVLPWMADQPTDSVYIIRAPISRFICFNKAKRSLPPCMFSLFWNLGSPPDQPEWMSRWLNSCVEPFLKPLQKRPPSLKQDLHIDAKIIEDGCVSKSARNFVSKVESRLNYPPEV